MKLANHILAYNVNRFIEACIKNTYSEVDFVYISYQKHPWSYNVEAAGRSNPTNYDWLVSLVERLQKDPDCRAKLTILEDESPTEHDTRNKCLDQAKRDGCDWLIIQDADEFYTNQGWAMLKEAMRTLDARYDRILTSWYNFWKSAEYVLTTRHGSIKDVNEGFAVRCRPDIKFIKARTSNVPRTRSIVIDAPCYHYGYVMDDEEMHEKISTWGHSHEFNRERWYRLKWLGWTEVTQLLHPVIPNRWPKAVRFPNEQPLFALPYTLRTLDPTPPTFGTFFAEKAYDTRVTARAMIRETRAFIRGATRR